VYITVQKRVPTAQILYTIHRHGVVGQQLGRLPEYLATNYLAISQCTAVIRLRPQ